MSPSFIARFVDAFIGGLFKTIKDKLIDIGLFIAAVLFWWATGQLSKQLWQDIPPLAWGICLIVLYHTLQAGIRLWKQVPEQQAQSGLTSIVLSQDGTPFRFSDAQGQSHPAYRAKILLVTFIMLAICAGVSYVTWAVISIRKQITPANPPTPVPVSITLGCGWDHIPIHIPSNFTIHVMRLSPAILYGNPSIPSVGVFDPVSAGESAMDWPSKRDGRWMTREEFHRALTEQGWMPTPYAFNCTLTNFSSVTLEEISATLIVDTVDKKRHLFPIKFDPLMSGHSFPFYVVNVCSSGVTATMVQWGDRASVRPLGEDKSRIVSLNFEKRSWPSELMVLGGSSFLWSGMQNCTWDRK